MSGPQVVWSVSESSDREREKKNLFFVLQMRQIWNVTQFEVAGEGKCVFKPYTI